MKNIFIKLHLQDNDSSIYVNINHIVSLYELPNCTSVETTNTPYRVREHKDEIIKMINKIQKVWI
jgi:enoyl reductase-like protein